MQDATAGVGELHLEEPIVAWTRADILRMIGANGGDLEGAWRTAIDSARAKEMRMFELRSTVGLARLLDGRGNRSEARQMLAPVYESFSEGADTHDLIQAKH